MSSTGRLSFLAHLQGIELELAKIAVLTVLVYLQVIETTVKGIV